MKITPARSAITVPDAPTVSFDHTSPFAPWFLTALLTWPKDQRQQAGALATYAAQQIAYFDDHYPGMASQTLQSTVKAMAARLGIPEADVLSMPQARIIAEYLREHGSNVRGMIETEVLRPAGGLQALADAPGAKVLKEQVEAAFNGGVRSVGWALLLIATIRARHPDISPSKNKAFAIMERTCPERTWVGVSVRALEDHWQEWREIAPLSAALWAWQLEWTVSGGRLEDGLASAFNTQAGIDSLLRWAKWFRNFGVTFKPQGAREPLLPSDKTFDYQVGLPAREPPLPPLTPTELAAAKAYRAPTLKSGY